MRLLSTLIILFFFFVVVHLKPCHYKLQFKGEPNCLANCTCIWEGETLMSNCANLRLYEIPSFDELKICKVYDLFDKLHIDLRNNSLTQLGRFDAEKVTVLLLSNNNIKNIYWIPSTTQVLHLDNNQLTNLSINISLFILTSNTLTNITLGSNPWKCENIRYLYAVLQHKKTVIDTVVCESNQPSLIDTKHNNNNIVMYITLSIFLVILLAMIILFWKFNNDIKVWLFKKDWCLWYVNKEEPEIDKEYDVYISFTASDEDFILRTLLPFLGKGANPYTVTLHFGLFTNENSLPNNMISSVRASRRTLIVLSDNFLNNIWKKKDYRVALTQGIINGKSKLIIVLFGEIKKYLLDDFVRDYMSHSTLIKWNDPKFEDKLRYALPHYRYRQRITHAIYDDLYDELH